MPIQKPRIELWFCDRQSPTLERVCFADEGTSSVFTSVRGKSGQAHGTTRSFQWTTAVQGLSILLLRSAHCLLAGDSRQCEPRISGPKGSIVSSLDYALDKEPLWLIEMFGSAPNGQSAFRGLVHRANPGGKRPSDITISLKLDKFFSSSFQIFWDKEPQTSAEILLRLLRTIETNCSAVEYDIARNPVIENALTPQPSEPFVAIDAVHGPHPLLALAQQTKPRGSISAKSPFLKQNTIHGEVNTRTYESGNLHASAYIYDPKDLFHLRKSVSVCVHSSCIHAEVFGGLGCDCASHLQNCVGYLAKEGGVLLYIFNQKECLEFAHQKDLQKQIAVRRQSLEFAASILHDLHIQSIIFLTNNPNEGETLNSNGLSVKIKPVTICVTPQNLSILHGQMADTDLIANLKVLNEIYFLAGANQNYKPNVTTWLFAGDDTLWEENLGYEDAIRQFIDHVVDSVPALARETIRSLIDCVEKQTIDSEVGLGPDGFIKSLREALKILQKEYGSIQEPKDFFSSAAERLRQLARPIDGQVLEVLKTLKQRGDRLVLFCQGPIDIQLQKISQSNIGIYFDTIAVTAKKSRDAFSAVLENLGINSSHAISVGSSLQYDIIPAIEAGIKSLHYLNPNSWYIMNSANGNDQSFRELNQLSDALTIQSENLIPFKSKKSKIQ